MLAPMVPRPIKPAFIGSISLLRRLLCRWDDGHAAAAIVMPLRRLSWPGLTLPRAHISRIFWPRGQSRRVINGLIFRPCIRAGTPVSWNHTIFSIIPQICARGRDTPGHDGKSRDGESHDGES